MRAPTLFLHLGKEQACSCTLSRGALTTQQTAAVASMHSRNAACGVQEYLTEQNCRWESHGWYLSPPHCFFSAKMPERCHGLSNFGSTCFLFYFIVVTIGLLSYLLVFFFFFSLSFFALLSCFILLSFILLSLSFIVAFYCLMSFIILISFTFSFFSSFIFFYFFYFSLFFFFLTSFFFPLYFGFLLFPLFPSYLSLPSSPTPQFCGFFFFFPWLFFPLFVFFAFGLLRGFSHYYYYYFPLSFFPSFSSLCSSLLRAVPAPRPPPLPCGGAPQLSRRHRRRTPHPRVPAWGGRGRAAANQRGAAGA